MLALQELHCHSVIAWCRMHKQSSTASSKCSLNMGA